MVNNSETKQSTDRGAGQAERAGRAGVETLLREGEAAANAARHGIEGNAETVRRMSETVGDAARREVRNLAEGQQQFLQTATEQFEEVSRAMAQTVQGATEHLRTFMALPDAARGGLQDLQQSMAGIAERILQTNLRASQEFFRLASPTAFIDLQQRFVRDYLNTLMEGSATVIRAIRRTADQTLRPLDQQIEQRRGG